MSKWTVVGGTWQIESGELSGQTNAFGQRIRANGLSLGNHAVHVRIKWISGTYFEHGPYLRGQSPNEQNNGYMALLSTWSSDSRHRLSRMSGGSETTLTGQGSTNPSKNVWYNFVIKLHESELKSSISPIYSTEISSTDSSFSVGTLCLFGWAGSSEQANYDDIFVRQYVSPEPNHTDWGSEETSNQVIIDQKSVSDPRADIGSIQEVGFHAIWSKDSSNVVGGSIFVNGTEYITNSTGWVNLVVNSPVVGKTEWSVTGVNCNGVTWYAQTIQNPSIIWDQIMIVNGGVTDDSIVLGETTTIWFQAMYDYDDAAFVDPMGSLYVNGSAMSWSTTNNRWEYGYTGTTLGSKSFIVTGVTDSLYNLNAFNSAVGVQTITVSGQSTLTLSLDSSTTYIGYKVKIGGNLAYPNGTGISEAYLLLTYSVTGGDSWNDMTSVITTIDGNYQVVWMPDATGNYIVKVAWEGNETLNVGGKEVYANVAVILADEESVFSVVSNSTITMLTFNSTSKTLKFTVTGVTGTTGYTNVTIAKTLMTDIDGLTVYLDENQIEYTLISTDDYWLLHFTYQHSSHKIVINLGSQSIKSLSPANLVEIAVYSSIIIVLITAIYYSIKRRSNRPHT